MIKALKTLAVGLPLAAATLVAVPGTASADLNQCPRGSFCVWRGDNFQGGYVRWTQGTNDSSWWDNGMHDDAESLFNNVPSSSSATVRDNVMVYKDVNYGNFGICVRPGETYDAGMNDNDYDSHFWVPGC
ncbi:peptidase inhibitor family I36 protein [Spirillospora sp. CA-253888]